jgi:type IV secretion system protein VirB5
MSTPLNDEMNDTPPRDLDTGIAYAANFRYYSALKVGISALLAGLLLSVAGNVWQSRRPPTVLVVRVDEAGAADAIRYNSANYTPREAEIKSRLNDWAIDRYRLRKDIVGDTFKRNYYYLNSTLAARLMDKDAPLIAKVMSGSGEEQDVVINSVQFTDFDSRKLAHGIVGSGEARIDLSKILNPTGTEEKQHWVVTVKYEVNPEYAATRSISDPRYQTLNPLGVTITSFHEDRAFN